MSEPQAVRKDSPDDKLAETRSPTASTNQRLLILLAKQRSGTHAITRLLGSGEDVRNLGEVFFAFHKMLPGTFFEYRQQMVRQSPRLAFPSSGHQLEIWRAYCQHLQSLYPHRHLLLDIKYNSWHHFNGIWQNPSDPPEMVKLVKSNKLPVVHLIRRNKFAQACSEYIALSRQVWDSSQNGSSVLSGPVSIPPQMLQTQMNKSRAETELFRSFFSDYDHYTELVYEDALKDNRLSEDALQKLQKLTGSDSIGVGLETPLRKVITDLRRSVSNAAELEKYFAGSRWEEQVSTSLAGS